MTAVTAETVLSEDRTLIRNVHAPKTARTFIRWQLLAWGVPDLIETSELIASELVTNAVQHALREIIGIRLECAGNSVKICVWDDNAHDMPEVAPVDSGSEHGRGLLITEALSDHWGTYRVASGGKCVYAIITERPA